MARSRRPASPARMPRRFSRPRIFLTNVIFMAAHGTAAWARTGEDSFLIFGFASQQSAPAFGCRHDQEKVAMAVSFTLNGKNTTLDADPDMPLLWAVREDGRLDRHQIRLRASRCAAHAPCISTASRFVPASRRARPRWQNRQVTTIEGLRGKVRRGRRCRRRGSNCRYPSAAIASRARSCRRRRCLARKTRRPRMPTSTAAMSGNICRCATYTRIRAAIHDAAHSLEGMTDGDS